MDEQLQYDEKQLLQQMQLGNELALILPADIADAAEITTCVFCEISGQIPLTSN